MRQQEDLNILGQEFNSYLLGIKVTRWEHFARYSLEQMLSMPGINFEHLKTISRRLNLKGLNLVVPISKLEEYYQRQHNISVEYQSHTSVESRTLVA